MERVFDSKVFGGGSAWVTRMAEAARDWWARSKQWREFDDLAAEGMLDSVLEDIGLSRGEIPTVMHAFPRSGRRHEDMMRWTGVDPERLPPTADIREAQWLCIRCGAAKECDAWRGLPESQRGAPTFCPNIETFERIRAWQHRTASHHEATTVDA